MSDQSQDGPSHPDGHIAEALAINRRMADARIKLKHLYPVQQSDS